MSPTHMNAHLSSNMSPMVESKVIFTDIEANIFVDRDMNTHTRTRTRARTYTTAHMFILFHAVRFRHTKKETQQTRIDMKTL